MDVLPTLLQIYAEHEGKVSDKWSIYIEEYQRIFSPYRSDEIDLLEIGVQNGGSLEIWARYFPKARAIVGCEIDESCRQLKFSDPRISLVIGDANAEQIAHAVIAKADKFNLVIDDGSHQSGDIARSFAFYFSHIADGGIYVAEDLHCSYWGNFAGGLYHPLSSMAFFKILSDIVNHEHWGIDKARIDLLAGFRAAFGLIVDEEQLQYIHSVEFVNSLCIVRKCVPNKNNLGVRVIAGSGAMIWDGALQLQDSFQVTPDQSTNPWALKAQPEAEKIAVSNEIISGIKSQLVQINALTEQSATETTALKNSYIRHFSELSSGNQSLMTRLEEGESRLFTEWAQRSSASEESIAKVVYLCEKNEQDALAELSKLRERFEAQQNQGVNTAEALREQLRESNASHAARLERDRKQAALTEQRHAAAIRRLQNSADIARAESLERERSVAQHLEQLATRHQVEKEVWKLEVDAVRQGLGQQMEEQLKREAALLLKMETAEKATKKLQDKFLELLSKADEARLSALNSANQRHAQYYQRSEAELGRLRETEVTLEKTLRNQAERHRQELAKQEERFVDSLNGFRHNQEVFAQQQAGQAATQERVHMKHLRQLQDQLQTKSLDFEQREFAHLADLEKLAQVYEVEVKTIGEAFTQRELLLRQELVDAKNAMSLQMTQLGEIANDHALAVHDVRANLDQMSSQFVRGWTSLLSRFFQSVGKRR